MFIKNQNVSNMFCHDYHQKTRPTTRWLLLSGEANLVIFAG